MMKKANTYCYYLLISFGILSVAYALKLALVNQIWPGSVFYFLTAIFCVWLLKVTNNHISHRQVSVAMIIFFTVSIINGNLHNIGWIVVSICMLYLLLDVIYRNRKPSC